MFSQQPNNKVRWVRHPVMHRVGIFIIPWYRKVPSILNGFLVALILFPVGHCTEKRVCVFDRDIMRQYPTSHHYYAALPSEINHTCVVDVGAIERRNKAHRVLQTKLAHNISLNTRCCCRCKRHDGHFGEPAS